MNGAGEYGNMGDVTYAAIYDVQLWYSDNLTGGKPVSFVCDEYGSFRDGSGEYYEIDETTYNYILTKLPAK